MKQERQRPNEVKGPTINNFEQDISISEITNSIKSLKQNLQFQITAQILGNTALEKLLGIFNQS